MCAPKVMDVVNKRLSRRDLFRLGGMSAAALAVGGRARAQTSPTTLSYSNLADLTHTLSPAFPVFPGFNQMEKTTLVTVEDNGFYANQWTLGEHTGTHMDAPAHFIGGATTADQLSLSQLITPLAVVDISDRVADNPDAVVMVSDLQAWEEEHGPLPAGAAVMMYSGWEERLAEFGSFVNQDADGILHFPGFSPEAAEFLVNERDITGIGVDTLSLDYGPSQTFAVHLTILGAGRWGLENVANLASVPASGATLIVGGLKVEDASGGPVRLIAAWE